jgi:hypothetical protein
MNKKPKSNEEEKKTTSKKPVSLALLDVREALSALLQVKTKPPKEKLEKEPKINKRLGV